MSRWLAPGKLFLAGEYAVTLGEPALIAAVAPWGQATGQAGQGVSAIFPGAAQQRGRLHVDTSDFFFEGRKLGFGSSATAATLITAAASKDWRQPQLWLAARQTHERLTGGAGSGGDLAAVLHGGVGIFTRLGDTYDWRPLRFPDRASLLVVKAPSAANTRQWLARFNDAAKDNAFAAWRQGLRECVLAFAKPDADWTRLLQQAADAYEKLQAWLGADLYPTIFRECLALAKTLQIPFKPSGAGGGDMGFFYCADANAQTLAHGQLAAAGIHATTLRPTVLGLHQVAA